jgi:hypothetical protein
MSKWTPGQDLGGKPRFNGASRGLGDRKSLSERCAHLSLRLPSTDGGPLSRLRDAWAVAKSELLGGYINRELEVQQKSGA